MDVRGLGKNLRYSIYNKQVTQVTNFLGHPNPSKSLGLISEAMLVLGSVNQEAKRSTSMQEFDFDCPN